MSLMSTPGLAMPCMCLRTWRWTSAACRTSLIMSNCRRSISRFSAAVSRQRWLRSGREKGRGGGGAGWSAQSQRVLLVRAWGMQVGAEVKFEKLEAQRL